LYLETTNPGGSGRVGVSRVTQIYGAIKPRFSLVIHSKILSIAECQLPIVGSRYRAIKNLNRQ